jgi:hypothetical protein
MSGRQHGVHGMLDWTAGMRLRVWKVSYMLDRETSS